MFTSDPMPAPRRRPISCIASSAARFPRARARRASRAVASGPRTRFAARSAAAPGRELLQVTMARAVAPHGSPPYSSTMWPISAPRRRAAVQLPVQDQPPPIPVPSVSITMSASRVRRRSSTRRCAAFASFSSRPAAEALAPSGRGSRDRRAGCGPTRRRGPRAGRSGRGGRSRSRPPRRRAGSRRPRRARRAASPASPSVVGRSRRSRSVPVDDSGGDLRPAEVDPDGQFRHVATILRPWPRERSPIASTEAGASRARFRRCRSRNAPPAEPTGNRPASRARRSEAAEAAKALELAPPDPDRPAPHPRPLVVWGVASYLAFAAASKEANERLADAAKAALAARTA